MPLSLSDLGLRNNLFLKYHGSFHDKQFFTFFLGSMVAVGCSFSGVQVFDRGLKLLVLVVCLFLC